MGKKKLNEKLGGRQIPAENLHAAIKISDAHIKISVHQHQGICRICCAIPSKWLIAGKK